MKNNLRCEIKLVFYLFSTVICHPLSFKQVFNSPTTICLTLFLDKVSNHVRVFGFFSTIQSVRVCFTTL
uniref:Uncharacterized protein n=1 Tax=uncultured marine virus TaxID=186617 RepID=A0A0F7L677_9VIRU|nr:hypothetical protein [uncultured marine virus]